jgi:hypothetical protein
VAAPAERLILDAKLDRFYQPYRLVDTSEPARLGVYGARFAV